MELSQAASDILGTFPRDTVIYQDSAAQVHVKVPRESTLDGSTLHRWHNVVVDFRSRMVTVHLEEHSEPLCPSSPRPCTLEPTTASEHRAADMASAMGRIDLDDLLPSFSIESSGGTTRLIIGRLLRVDDSALRRHLSVHATHYRYHMEARQIVVHFAMDKKRKDRR